MQIFKEFVTLINALLALLLWIAGRGAKEKATAICFAVMAVLIIANMFLIWN